MECQLEKKSLNSNTASLDHRVEPIIKRNKGPKIGDLLKKRKIREEYTPNLDIDDEDDSFQRANCTKQQCQKYDEYKKQLKYLKEQSEKHFSFEQYQKQYELINARKNVSYQSYCIKNIKTKQVENSDEAHLKIQKKLKTEDQQSKCSDKDCISSTEDKKVSLELDENQQRDCTCLINEDEKKQNQNIFDDDNDESNMNEDQYKNILNEQYQIYEESAKRKKKVKKILTYQEKYMELQRYAMKNGSIEYTNAKKMKKGVLMSKQMFLQQSENTTIQIQNQINVGNNFTIHSNIQSLNAPLQNQQHHAQQQNYPQYQQQDVIMQDQGPEYLQKKIRLLEGCNKYLDKVSWEAPEEELDKMEKDFRQSTVKPEQTINQLNNNQKRTTIQDKKFEKVYNSLRKSIQWSEKIFNEDSMIFNKMLIEHKIEQRLLKDDFYVLNSYKIQIATPFNEQNLIDKRKNEQILEFFMKENNFVMDRALIRDIATFKGQQHLPQPTTQINQHKIYQQQQQQHIPSQFNNQAKQVPLRTTFGQQQQQGIVLGGQQDIMHYQQNQRLNANQQVVNQQIHTINHFQDMNNAAIVAAAANQMRFDPQLKNVVNPHQLHPQLLNISQQDTQQFQAQQQQRKVKGNLQSQSNNFNHYIKYFQQNKNNQFSAGGNSSSNNLGFQNSKMIGKNEIVILDSPKRSNLQQLSQNQNTQINQESNQTFSKECHAQTINTNQNQFDQSFFQNTQINMLSQQLQQNQTSLSQQALNQQKSQFGFNSANILDQNSNIQQPSTQWQNKVNSSQYLSQSQLLPNTQNQSQQGQNQQQLLSQNQQLQNIQQQFNSAIQMNSQQQQQNHTSILNQLSLNQYPLMNQFNKLNYVSYNPYTISSYMQNQLGMATTATTPFNQYFTQNQQNVIQQNPQTVQQQQGQPWQIAQTNTNGTNTSAVDTIVQQGVQATAQINTNKQQQQQPEFITSQNQKQQNSNAVQQSNQNFLNTQNQVYLPMNVQGLQICQFPQISSSQQVQIPTEIDQNNQNPQSQMQQAQLNFQQKPNPNITNISPANREDGAEACIDPFTAHLQYQQQQAQKSQFFQAHQNNQALQKNNQLNTQINQVTQSQQQQNQLYLLMHQQQGNHLQNAYQMFMLPNQILANSTVANGLQQDQQHKIQQAALNLASTQQPIISNQFILSNQLPTNQII